MKIYQDILLSEKTTIGLGNKVKYFIEFYNKEDIYKIFEFLKKEQLNYFILGEGSNVIGPEESLEIAILHPKNSSIIFRLDDEEFQFEFPTSIEYKEFYDINIHKELLYKIFYNKNKLKNITIIADAGINWDYFVFFCIVHGIQSLFALSGIPGKIGATPVQNVGAYGEEVKHFIESVEGFFINNNYRLIENRISNQDCKFEYRNSIFKTHLNQYLIHRVIFHFQLNQEISIKYKEVQETWLNSTIELDEKEQNFFKNIPEENIKNQILEYYRLRKCIYSIRRRKGMILDKHLPWNKSAGSFFMNPFLNELEFKNLQNQIKKKNPEINIPFYKENNLYKIPSAWLIEYVGFYKGFKNKEQTIGISPFHSLALINYDGTVKDLKQFMTQIQDTVYQKTGIYLQPEPIFIDEVINKY